MARTNAERQADYRARKKAQTTIRLSIEPTGQAGYEILADSPADLVAELTDRILTLEEEVRHLKATLAARHAGAEPASVAHVFGVPRPAPKPQRHGSARRP